jgi:hypothetical protein
MSETVSRQILSETETVYLHQTPRGLQLKVEYLSPNILYVYEGLLLIFSALRLLLRLTVNLCSFNWACLFIYFC